MSSFVAAFSGPADLAAAVLPGCTGFAEGCEAVLCKTEGAVESPDTPPAAVQAQQSGH